MEKEELNRGFGLWSSLALVIGTIIGSGIFFKQGAVLQTAGSTSSALLAWLAGGILTLTAGMTVAEVGSQMTETGGLYLYLTKLYGKTIGFLSGWMQVVFYGPAMMGAIASYFGLLFTALFNLPIAWSIPIGMVGLGFIGLVNSLPNTTSAFFQVVTTTIKLMPIIGLIIFGLFFGQHDALGQTVTSISNSHAGGFGVAVLATLFAYDGWVTLANISGEIKNPQKTLPKAIIYGLLVVIVAYVGVSFGTFSSLGGNEIVAYGNQATMHVAKAAFGLWGGRLLTLAILISLLGTLNGKVVSFPRVCYAMAKQGDFPFAKFFGSVHAKSKTPNGAIWLMIGIGYVMMWVTDPNKLTDYAVFITFLFYILALVGCFILRHRDPKGEKRTFSMPLYPWIPIVAILGSIYVEVSEIFNDLQGIAISVIIVVLGLPVYYWLNHRKSK